MAGTKKIREQHVAVFGESGSGKTVLVSSFYGAAQEQTFLKDSPYHVIADDTGHGTRLKQNYLGMKKSAVLPDSTQFAATAYSFAIKPRVQPDAKTAKSKPFDELRLVWHDYPGEWFEQDPSSETEAQRRVDTFRALMQSDVALVLVDGQKLRDHVGEEEKYLKSLFMGMREGLIRLRDEILVGGELLAEFPRVWMIALSKADLHPGMDVHEFHDLVVEKAGDDIVSLRDAVRDFVQMPDALSVGEDFLLLSSARFEPGRIEVTERVGLDLVLPIATLLPLERLVGWSEKFEIPSRWIARLADNADALATVLVGTQFIATFLTRVPKVGPVLGKAALPALAAAVKISASKVKEINEQAQANKDYLTATLTRFRLDLEQGVQDDLLTRRA